MSPMFLREFKKERGHCPCCGSKKKKSYSLCERHLHIAKLHWRVWATRRRVLGKCFQCDETAIPEAGRCELHREANKKKMKAWTAANPNHWRLQLQKKSERIKELRKQGLCGHCPDRAPLEPGRTTCVPCKKRMRCYEKGTATDREVNAASLRARRLSKSVERARAAQRELEALGVGGQVIKIAL